MNLLSKELKNIAKIIIATDERRGNGSSFEEYTGAVHYTYKGQEYECTVKNAYFSMDKEGNFNWDQGDFISGDWGNGTWKSGAWKNGVWHNGTFENGTWVKGVWHDGVWLDGIFKEGWASNIIWHKGIWKYGVFENGEWHDGTWLGGFFHGGLWKNGEWEGGKWYGGEWIKGRIRGTEYTISPSEFADGVDELDEDDSVITDQKQISVDKEEKENTEEIPSNDETKSEN